MDAALRPATLENPSPIYAEHFAASSSTGEEENKRKLRIARLVAARRLVVYVSVSLVLRLFRRSVREEEKDQV